LDELIHQFLLHSGYPRAAILADVTSVLNQVDGETPSFVIVDPATAARLAVFSVVGPLNSEALSERARVTGEAASSLGGNTVQGYVIRVDVDGASEAEQVQFYRVWPNTTLQQLSARTFPDLDSLRVNQKIALQAMASQTDNAGAAEDPTYPLTSLGMGAYVPGILLLLVALADWLSAFLRGEPLLGMTHSVLLGVSAVLLSLPAIVRFQRD